MSEHFEKLNPSIEAIKQLVQLRKVCQYLLNNGYAKKTGKRGIPPLPLFNKNAGIPSIDAITGGHFLKGKDLSAQTASKLMAWVKRHYPWVFFAKDEVLETAKMSWENLIHAKQYRSSFMNFCLVSDSGNKKLIDIIGLQNSAYEEFEHINIKERWYLKLSGRPGESFFVALESLSNEKMTVQIAPLNISGTQKLDGFISTLSNKEKSLYYPSNCSISFNTSLGGGYRRLIAIKSRTLPIQAKSIENDFMLTRQELDKFASHLIEQKAGFVVDQYEFILVS